MGGARLRSRFRHFLASPASKWLSSTTEDESESLWAAQTGAAHLGRTGTGTPVAGSPRQAATRCQTAKPVGRSAESPPPVAAYGQTEARD
nr:hypothetical protein Itr_chr06CG15530 [Ipomoea trifida]GMD03952.1 hypothetical protein Iba_chr06aCG13820 [Ipomoea batatas]